MSRGHREIDHSGDVGVEAWGATREQLFEEATLGLFALISSAAVSPVRERPVEATGDDEAALLVDWLNQVILCGAIRGEVYSAVRIDACGADSVRGNVVGDTASPAVHALRFDVKAATYHGLVFESDERGYRARVIFDL